MRRRDFLGFLHQNRPVTPSLTHSCIIIFQYKDPSTLNTMKLTAAVLILASSTVKGQTATLEPGNFSEGLTIKE